MTADELRNKIAHWRTVLNFARAKAARTDLKEDHDSVRYAEGKVDQYLDQYLTLIGEEVIAPTCSSGPCTERMSRFGTRVWLCGECDFRECVACRQRVHSLTAVNCPHCSFTVGPPRSVEDEL